MKNGKWIMYMAAGMIVLIAGASVYFSIPYSPVRAEFERLKCNLYPSQHYPEEVFTADDIKGLPVQLQQYFIKCGFIGKPKTFNIKIVHKNVDFVLSSKKLKIDCIQFNSGIIPSRIALIDTNIYGIPFEGLDVYQSGAGSMKGVIAKNIVLFHETGESMDQSSLVNCLAESLLVPNLALQDFIVWEEISESCVKGTITYEGLSVSGTFTFDSNGYLTTFTTDDRIYVDTSGHAEPVKWSAVCGEFREVNGIMQPQSLKAIWHLPEADLIYFAGNDTVIEYNVTE